MIRVLIYVSGISLAQFSATDGKPAVVVMSNGHHAYTELGSTHIPHTLTIVQGSNTTKPLAYDTSRPPVIELTASCDGTCPAIVPPADFRIANLGELLGRTHLSIRDSCDEAGEAATCGLTNGHVSFTGPWKVAATVDCYGPYPSGTPRLGRHNFVSSVAAWKVRYDTAPVQVGNSTLFWADVEESELATLLRVNGNAVALEVIPVSEDDPFCTAQSGDSTVEKCVAVAIRNRGESATAFVGGADPHFAPLFGLLGESIAFGDTWLPVALDDPLTICKGGTGCCGYPGCISGYVVAQ
jgi:hypothetical protein